MRRLFAALLIFMLLVPGFALAALPAQDAAIALARQIPCMQNIRAGEGQKDSAVWNDTRLEGECCLIVHAGEIEADRHMLAACSKKTAVRAVGNCTISMDSSLPPEEISAYMQALADVLETELASPVHILNVNTKKFHLPFCTSVEDMKDSNKLPCAADYALVLEYGYVPCKRCCP